MNRCWGRNRNLDRCARRGEWKFLCGEHQNQWMIGLIFVVFTIGGGSASLYSVFRDNSQSPIIVQPPKEKISETFNKYSLVNEIYDLIGFTMDSPDSMVLSVECSGNDELSEERKRELLEARRKIETLKSIDESGEYKEDIESMALAIRFQFCDGEGFLEDIENIQTIDNTSSIGAGLAALDKDPDEVDRIFKDLMRKNPTDYKLKASWAMVLITRKNYSLAEKVLQQILASDPKNKNAIYNLGLLLLDANRHTELSRLLADLDTDEIENPLLLNLIGENKLNQDKYMEAIQAMRKSVRNDPNDSYSNNHIIYRKIADAYEKLGKSKLEAKYRELAQEK